MWVYIWKIWTVQSFNFNYYIAKNPNMSHLVLSKWYRCQIFPTAQPQILTLLFSISEYSFALAGPGLRLQQWSSSASALSCFKWHKLYLIVPCCCICNMFALPSCYSCWEGKPRTHGQTTSDLVLLWQLKVTCSHSFLLAIMRASC